MLGGIKRRVEQLRDLTDVGRHDGDVGFEKVDVVVLGKDLEEVSAREGSCEDLLQRDASTVDAELPVELPRWLLLVACWTTSGAVWGQTAPR